MLGSASPSSPRTPAGSPTSEAQHSPFERESVQGSSSRSSVVPEAKVSRAGAATVLLPQQQEAAQEQLPDQLPVQRRLRRLSQQKREGAQRSPPSWAERGSVAHAVRHRMPLGTSGAAWDHM